MTRTAAGSRLVLVPLLAAAGFWVGSSMLPERARAGEQCADQACNEDFGTCDASQNATFCVQFPPLPGTTKPWCVTLECL